MQIVLDANVALDWHLRTAKGDAYSLPLWKRGAAGNVRYIVPEHFNTEVARIVVIRGLKGGRDVPYFHFARENGIPIATRDEKIIEACVAWNVQHWMP